MKACMRPVRFGAFRLSLAALVLLAACARQGAPPGGPVDRTPPRVMAAWPRPDSTSVPLKSKISILFNEAVDHRSCEESIFITPRPAEAPRFSWHGNRVEIEIPGGLLPGRTYVITVGTGTKDRRNIALASSWSLAFATGPTLDRGRIAGTIYSDLAVTGMQVWAYELSGGQEPNPAALSPLYVTQADSRGKFSLNYLAFGRYRLFAVADRDLNGLYDAEREHIGVASRDLLLTSEQPDHTDIALRAAVQDTTPPALAGATAPDNRHVDLRFSERMAERGLLEPGTCLISAAADTLQILNALLDQRNPAYLHLLTSPQQAAMEYTVVLQQGWDLSGLALIDSGRTARFTGAANPDSGKPYFIAAWPEDKARHIERRPQLRLTFSEALDQPLAEAAFALLDSAGKRLPGRFSWPDGASLQFLPDSLLRPQGTYSVAIAVDSIRDRQGNRVADTLIALRFQTLNPDTLSEISGTLRDAARNRRGSFHLTARQPKGAQYQARLESEGPYRFEKILPGDYVIDFFRDEDGDGRYSNGQPFPWRPAERYAVYPDTIKVRARWPNEGNDLLLPE